MAPKPPKRSGHPGKAVAALCHAGAGFGRRGDRPVPTIRPRIVMDGAERRVLMPGDPGYF